LLEVGSFELEFTATMLASRPTALWNLRCCLVFNARGNNYRLICRVKWPSNGMRGALFIKHFLTHAEYDRGNWKADGRRRQLRMTSAGQQQC